MSMSEREKVNLTIYVAYRICLDIIKNEGWAPSNMFRGLGFGVESD